MGRIFLAVLASFSVFASSAYAKARLDCPMRDAAYSIESPLIDVLLSEPAKTVMEVYLPGVMAKMPPIFASTTAPSFASIITLRNVADFLGGDTKPDMAKLDAALRALAVTPADTIARCARYDDDRPKFSMTKGQKHILLFEKMTGFRDTPSVLAANAAFKAMAERKGWALVVTDKGGAMHPSVLKKFDVVIWNNVSGDVLTLTQRRAFRHYIESGGAFVGVHGSAGDPVYFWDWYADGLIGARFVGHPSDPQFQYAQIRIEANISGIGASLGPGWQMNDEWYSFAKSPRLTGAHVVATLDEQSYTPGVSRFGPASLVMGDHPIAWSRCVGKGRAFYSAIGHRPETYVDANHLVLLEQAIGWAAAGRTTDCNAGASR
jgi:uncharacterized protein